MVEFFALGGLTVSADGVERNIGGPRQRRLVAMLLIHRNTVVSVDRLVEAVFAGAPTPAATTTLRSYVARLRKVLDTGAPRFVEVVTQAPGYLLRVPSDAFDVARLEAASAEGRVLLDRGDPGGAAVVLRGVADAWRGDPYPEYDDEDWVRPEAQRLRELQLVARELLFEAELTCGRSIELIPELDALTAGHPLREGFRSQLMLALYRSGRQADALRTFQNHREALVEQLGLDPAPTLQMLEERILSHDDTLLVAEPAGVALRGYRLGARLGSGHDGPVYAAHLPGVDRDAVIRVVRPEIVDRPEFVRTFDAAAHRLASLHHPAIVSIHDHWREPGGAYLVMRRLRGGTLADRLDRRLDHWSGVAGDVETIVRRIGGALAAAHDVGIVHGRVTARSILFDESGEPFLSDFALGVSEIDGSQADDVAAFADIVRACAGHGSDADVNEAIAGLVDGDVRPPMSSFVPTVLAAIAGATMLTEKPRPNPYKGLRAFDEADAVDFFGREGVVDELVKRLCRDDVSGRLVLVVGGSGTGKSSVVRAGLLPRIRRGDPPDATGWFVTTMVPGDDPFGALAESLRQVAVVESAGLADELASEDGIDRVVRRLVPGDGELLVVIDQFEELFTATSDADQKAFLDGVVQAISSAHSRLRVVGTLRADFYDRPLAVQGFGAFVSGATVTIPAMTAAELEAAIVAPAQRVGRRVEGALVAELVDAVGREPAGLPALQFTLYELSDRGADVLRLADYRQLGGLGGAITARAEHLYCSLDADEQTLIRSVFEQLVVLSADGVPTRNRVARTDLSDTAGDPAIDRLIGLWAEARLLTLDRDERTRVPTVDVAHEALLREWPRLRRWIEDDREALIVLTQLHDAAASWVGLDRDAGALYRGARLAVALDVLDTGARSLAPTEQEFLRFSERARDDEERVIAHQMDRQRRANRRLRLQMLAVFVALVVALVGGFVAVDQRRGAEQARRVATGRELAAASEASLDEDPERSILLALEAIDVTREHGEAVRPKAVEALHRAIAASRVVLSVPDLGGALDWSPDGSVFVTEGPEESGVVDIRDAATGERVRDFLGHRVDINDVTFNADGTMFATTGDDGAIRVWETATGDQVAEYEGPDAEESVWGPSFSPDGSMIAAGWIDSSTVRVIDVGTGDAVAEIPGHTAFSTEFSPDNARLLVAGDGFATVVREIATASDVFLLGDGSTGPTKDAAFSPDGRWIATADGDGIARISDATTGEQRFTISGHSAAVNSVDWSSDSAKLATASDDGTALVSEVADGGTRQLVSVSARDTRNGLADVAFSPDGNEIMTGDFGLASVKVWNAAPTGNGEGASIEALALVRGSGTFMPTGDAIVVNSPGPDLSIRDADTGSALIHFDMRPVTDGAITRLALDPRGELLAGAESLPVHLWDTSSGKHLATTAPPDDDDQVFVVDLSWSPDGDFLAIAAAADRGWVSIVDRSGVEVARLDADPDSYIRSVAFDPTGNQLIATRLPPRNDPNRQGFEVWDWRAGKVVLDTDVEAGSVAVDPTSTRIATTRTLEGIADVWDAATGQQLMTLPSSSSIYAIAFRSDGQQVATGEADGTIRLWNPETGGQDLVLRGHEAAVSTVAFSPDGSKLASLDEDGFVRVWALDLDDLINRARSRLTRGLDDDECRQYLHRDRCSG